MDAKKEELESRLKELNIEVEKVITKRKEFLDENMHHFAEFQIDEKVWDCSKGQESVCTRHYRYHSKDPRYDTSFSIDCKITNGSFTDNTSRFGGFHPFVSIEDYENRTEKYIWKSGKFSRF